MNIGENEEINRLRNQSMLSWKKELQYLKRIEFRNNINILDAGCGPGFVSEKLFELYPNCTITALDYDPNMITTAKTILSNKGDRIEFIEGSITDLPCEDKVFDLVYARLLFQHLPDPEKALSEMYRVLKASGKVIVFDIDDDLMILLDPMPDVIQIILKKLGVTQASLGGNRYISRNFVRLLKKARFKSIDFDSMAVHSDLGIKEQLLDTFQPNIFCHVHKAGVLSDEEFRIYEKYHLEIKNNPDFIGIVNFFIAMGEK
ncbi:MAG: class I SAM-dependent methyltransferase [Candidatus Kariarchaeaceae archaeon]